MRGVGNLTEQKKHKVHGPVVDLDEPKADGREGCTLPRLFDLEMD